MRTRVRHGLDLDQDGCLLTMVVEW
jgi:hypothetical protein